MQLTGIRAIAYGICILCLGVDSGAAGDVTSSIPRQVRENGVFERIVVSTDEQFTLANLVGRADLVVEASTAGGRSYLDESETHIYTDYTFIVQDVIKNRRRQRLPVGSAITIRREGGSVDIDGGRAVTIENDFPPFDAREPYVLFLKEEAAENAYSVLGGAQGTFKAGDTITPVAAAAERPLSTSRAVFLDTVRALLQFME